MKTILSRCGGTLLSLFILSFNSFSQNWPTIGGNSQRNGLSKIIGPDSVVATAAFRLVLLLFVLLTTTLIFSQQKKIIIKADVDNLPKDSWVHITGGTDELGNWTVMRQMEKKSVRDWRFEASADVGDTLQFKFTRGDWSNEAVDSNGLEFPNFTYIVRKDTTLVYKIPNWRDKVLQKIVITPERLANKAGYMELIEGWKYKIGDDSSWADPSFDDRDWKTINPLLNKEDFGKLEWTGNIWFRNHIYIDSSLWNKPFGFLFVSVGAAEIYLNGKLLYRIGKIGSSKETEIIQMDRTPKHIVFDEKEEHILAVRYSNHSAEDIVLHDVPAGFTADIGDLNNFISNRLGIVREVSIHQLAFGAFILAFAIMHLLLFIFYPKAKENLFYSVSMLGFAAVIYTGTQTNFVDSIIKIITLLTINSIAAQISVLFGLLTVYASSYQKMPKHYIVFVIVSVLFMIQTIFFPALGGAIINYAFYIFGIILILEIVRVLIRSIRKKEPWGWGWIIYVGFLVAMVLIVYQILILSGVITQPLFGLQLVYVYGIVFLAVTVSINLSKKVSDTNKDLEKQLIQVKELSQITIEQERKAKEEELTRKLLEADNERKTKELEEARKLQLLMLPDKIPSLPGFDIAVYMKPATEVGGDYYDFKYNNNKTLLIAVGDATGHGMKAGTMVATVKALFTAGSVDVDIVSFLNKSNLVIRDMHMGNLYMAMLMTKIDGNQVTFSSAGMPPALLYRSKTKNVEEIRLQALPLGCSAGFEYSKKETVFMHGDTLLLMSDGFPELFNKQKEILDYHNAKEIFRSVAELSPNKIIDRLCEEADNWRDKAKQEDDITFVVVKVKQ